MRHIAIIGNGIAGITAARHLRKRTDDRITVISGETAHFFSRTALMYVYMGHMTFDDIKPYEDRFWEKNRIDLRQDYVTRIDAERRRLELESGNPVHYDVLIIATGARPNRFGWPGQDLAGVQGLYSWQDLQLMEQNTRTVRQAVIVGGGLIGIEVAEMLHSRRIPVTFLVRESSYWNTILPAEESALINRHIREHGIDLRLSTELAAIIDDGHGRAAGVRTNHGDELPAQFVALTAGVHPNTAMAAASGIPCGRGVLVNEFFETGLPGVYAVGDCAEIRRDGEERGRVEQLWYTGRMHGEAVAATICGERTRYDRGVLFNSAKFFDIEYQTYGLVNTGTEGERSLYWEHADGRRCIRIVYNDAQVIGFNLLGIRYRHHVCERWIAERRPLPYVLEHLREANFDPEFFPQFESALVDAWNRAHPAGRLQLRRRRGLLRGGQGR